MIYRIIAYILSLFRPLPYEPGRGGYETYTHRALLTSREVSNGFGSQREIYYLAARGIPTNFVDNPSDDHDVLCHVHTVIYWRRVVDLLTCGLCLVAAAATVTILISEISQPRSPSFISGGIQAVVLTIFSAPLTAYGCIIAMRVFGICQVERGGSQLTPRTQWEAHRGLIVNFVEGCVLYQVVLLSLPRVGPWHHAGQNALDPTNQVAIFILVLGCIALWFSSCQHARAENTNQGSTVVQLENDRYTGAGEASHPVTFDSFTYVGDTEMAVSIPVVD